MFDPPREDPDYQPLAENIQPQPGGYDFGQGGENVQNEEENEG